MGHRDVGGGDEVLVAVGRHLDVGGKAAEPVEHRRNCGPESVRRVGILERHAVHGKRRGERVGVDRAAGAVVGKFSADVGESVAGDKLPRRRRGAVDAELRDAGEHHTVGKDEAERRVEVTRLSRRTIKNENKPRNLLKGNPIGEPFRGISIQRYNWIVISGNNSEICVGVGIDGLAQLQIKHICLHCQDRLVNNPQHSIGNDFKRDVGEVGIEVGEIFGPKDIRVFANGGLRQVGNACESERIRRIKPVLVFDLYVKAGERLRVAIEVAGLRRTGYLDDNWQVIANPDDGGGDEVGVPFGGCPDVGDDAAKAEQLRRRRGPGAVRRGRIHERRPGERSGQRVGVDRAAGAVVAVLGVGAGKTSGGDERGDRRRQDGEAPVRDNPEDDVGEVRVKIGELVRRKPI